MTPETEALLRQCRASLLRQRDQDVATLLAYWFETLIGEEGMEEGIDDLCLLLDYRVQSCDAQISYATYTSWWEVEGYLEPGEGTFTCSDVPSLRLRLLDMAPQQFYLVIELAWRVRSLLTEIEGESCETCLSIEDVDLREMRVWLEQATPPTRLAKREPEAVLAPILSQPQLVADESKAQRRKREKEIARQARQLGYLVVYHDTSSWLKNTVRQTCINDIRPYIWIELLSAPWISLHADARTLARRSADIPTPHMQEQIAICAASYIARAQAQHYQARFYWSSQYMAVLDSILVEDAEQAAQELFALWTKFLKELPPPPPTHHAPVDPPWKRAINRLKSPNNTHPMYPLAETIVLPNQWADLLTREHLLTFLAFLDLPARTREAKAPLAQRLQERLDSDATAKAQFFEVFVHELIVPPWELETLLECTPTERKRWTEEGKLSVFSHDSFRKGGTQRTYPLFDRRVVLSISPAQREMWRTEHQAIVKERRRVSARAAAATRKAKQSLSEADVSTHLYPQGAQEANSAR